MNRRDLLKMLTALAAAPYVASAAKAKPGLDQLSVRPTKAFNTRPIGGYTGPRFNVSGFGDVSVSSLERFRVWAEENPDAECQIVRFYNKVQPGLADLKIAAPNWLSDEMERIDEDVEAWSNGLRGSFNSLSRKPSHDA